ncbi:MAG: hypothetical protein AMK75_02605 [Planctomycetes bacterium SM23_65]|nr:MAG: hypothetical protein AMK75_02605 [Planctomycetes bacterium SM23_65]
MDNNEIPIDFEPVSGVQPPSPVLKKAQRVLETLDEMKEEGVGVQAQLDFLRQHIPRLPKEEPPGTTPISVQLERQEEKQMQFNELKEAMRSVMEWWATPDLLPPPVQEVGTLLLKHLDDLREKAVKEVARHWKGEVELLSELWTSAPDISKLFPGLEQTSRKARQLPTETIPERPEPFDPPGQQELEIEQLSSSVVSKKFPLVREGDPVLASTHRDHPHVKAVQEEESNVEEVAPPLLRDAWTEALREISCDSWAFLREMRVDGGKILFWGLQTGETRLELLSKGDQTQITLRVLKDGKMWGHEETLSAKETQELHLDPSRFVKRALTP